MHCRCRSPWRLVAWIERGQGNVHRKYIAAHKELVGPLLTTWPSFAEAMYLLGRLRGWGGQSALWTLIEAGALKLHTHSENELTRMRGLMDSYKDTPMDLADASLVAAAESQGLRRIFTVDSDFYVY